MSDQEIFLFRDCEASDLAGVRELMTSIFGPFGDFESVFERWMASPLVSMVVAETAGRIVGFCTFGISEDTSAQGYTCFGDRAFSFLAGKRRVSALNLAVLPEFRGLDVGRALVDRQREWLRQQDFDVMMGTSWVHGRSDTSRIFFESAGFQRLGTSREFLRSQLPAGAECAVCQTRECQCESVLYGMERAGLAL